MKEELAIITKAIFGDWEGRLCISINVNFLSGASTLCIPWSEIPSFIKGIRDIKDLEGKACIILTNGDTVKFSKLFS